MASAAAGRKPALPGRPSTGGRSPPSAASGAAARCFSPGAPWAAPFARTGISATASWRDKGSHPPGAFRDLLPAGGGGRPQHQPGDPHPLCSPDPAGPAAEKIAGAGGVQHLRVRAGGNPAIAGGPGGHLPARLQIRRPQPGETAFPGGGLTPPLPEQPSPRWCGRWGPRCTGRTA